MAQILDIVTVGEKVIYNVDVDPSAGAGTPAAIGSLAFVNTGENYIKVGALDTAWDLVTTASSGTNVKQGDFKRLAIYDTDASGYSVDDQISQNGKLIDVILEDQPSRTEDITYTIPNPGDAITDADFVLTEGDQSINGDKTFNNNVVIQGNLDVNGTVTSVNTDNLVVEDKLITLNKKGIAASAGESGIEFEEDGSITAYIKTSADREKFCFNVPAIDFDACLDFDKLTANRDFRLPDEAGSLVVQPIAQTGVAKQIAFWTSLNQISNETGVDENSFTWDDLNNFLGVQTASPQSILHLFNQAITGTVDPTAVILGKAKLDENVGQGATIIGGSQIDGGNTASGVDSHAQGYQTTASGANSHAQGRLSTASGTSSHAQGGLTTASGTNSHAQGRLSTASGVNSHAQGALTTASGTNSHAQGYQTTASGENSHAQGRFSIAAGDHSTAIGTKAQTGANDGVTIITDSQDAESTAEVADSMKMRFQNGWDLVKGDGTDNSDGVNFRIRQASGNTTDGAAATIQTIVIPTDSTVMIKSKIVGVRTGGTAGAVGDSAAYEKTSVFKNIGGTVTVSKKQSDYTFEDQASWESSHNVSGTDAIVSVTGAANNDVRWHVTSYVQIVSHLV